MTSDLSNYSLLILHDPRTNRGAHVVVIPGPATRARGLDTTANRATRTAVAVKCGSPLGDVEGGLFHGLFHPFDCSHGLLGGLEVAPRSAMRVFHLPATGQPGLIDAVPGAGTLGVVEELTLSGHAW